MQQLLVDWVVKVVPDHGIHSVKGEIIFAGGEEIVWRRVLRHNVSHLQAQLNTGDADDSNGQRNDEHDNNNNLQ